jgi:hypothetical protein
MAAFAAILVGGSIDLREMRRSLRSWLEATDATAHTRDSVVLATTRLRQMRLRTASQTGR